MTQTPEHKRWYERNKVELNKKKCVYHKERYKTEIGLAIRIRITKRREELKKYIMAHYGPNGEAKCHHCGATDIRVLCLDHINNDGKQHREHSGSRLYFHLRKMGYPAGLQTLCANCNLIKEIERKKANRGY